MALRTEQRRACLGAMAAACLLAVSGCGTQVGGTGPKYVSSQALGQALVDKGICHDLVSTQPPNASPVSTDMTCRTATADPLYMHSFTGTTVLLGQEVGTCAVLGGNWQVVAPTRDLARVVQDVVGGKIGTCGS